MLSRDFPRFVIAGFAALVLGGALLLAGCEQPSSADAGSAGKPTGTSTDTAPTTQPKVELTVPDGPVKLAGVDARVLKGFDALEAATDAAVKDGQAGVDWSARVVVATGTAPQLGSGGQSRLKAQHAAETIAKRNALAACLGVKIGPTGRIQGLKDGELILTGWLRDFEVGRFRSEQRNGRTWWTAEVRVPMHGASSLAAKFYDQQIRRHNRSVANRERLKWVAPAPLTETVGDVIIIDARGTGAEPAMYPLILAADGRVCCDMNTAGQTVAVQRGMVAYATTKLPFEKLSTFQPVPAPAPRAQPRARRGLAAGPAWEPMLVDGMSADQWLLAQATRPASTQPTTQPTFTPRRRPRRKAVKAIRSDKTDKSVMVISTQDALDVTKSKDASSMVKSGRVLIVVDAAAGGMEGRLPTVEEILLARRGRR